MKKWLILIMVILMVRIVVADTWEYTLFVYEVKGTGGISDDIQMYNETIVVTEGTTGNQFNSGKSIVNISMNHTYFVFIKGNTTEADYNYAADIPTETHIRSTTFISSVDSVPWTAKTDISEKQYLINLTIIPDDITGDFAATIKKRRYVILVYCF